MTQEAKVTWFTDAGEIEGELAPDGEPLAPILPAAAEEKARDAFVRQTREVAASIGKDAAGSWSRAQELIEFAKRMNFAKIGIAFCAGLAGEAATLRDALTSHGFEVCGVGCSVEGPCNSVGQAMLLNSLGTDMNVMMGLCLGHDMAFLKYSDAPVTPLVVKDKVTCHNPAAALTCNYQRKKLFKE